MVSAHFPKVSGVVGAGQRLRKALPQERHISELLPLFYLLHKSEGVRNIFPGISKLDMLKLGGKVFMHVHNAKPCKSGVSNSQGLTPLM